MRAKNPGLAADLETAFASLRTRAAGGATPAELDALRRRLEAGLENAERALGDQPSAVNLFIQSFIIMLREGLEAILIVGALMTFLVEDGRVPPQAGHPHRRRRRDRGQPAHRGGARDDLRHLSPAHREALEGATMVVATVVLFYVSYWLCPRWKW